jgi:hypothetical protein
MLLRSALALPCVLAVGLSCKAKDDDHHDTAASSGSGSSSPDQVGQICEVPEDCYPEVSHDDLSGPVECLTRVRGGYCTHQCSTDEDCCAIEGECVSEFPQVCSPFESTGLMMCFLSCEDADVEAAGDDDPEVYCQREASPDFICRSTGGGALNRRVCVPGDCGVGAWCGDDEDCSGDLVCLHEIDGGYCARRDCEANADCPMGSACVVGPDFNYCARQCERESDCTFCRTSDHYATCASDVTFAEDGTAGPVCVVR